MTATAEITVTHVADALLVPNAALRFTPPAAQAQGGPAASACFHGRLASSGAIARPKTASHASGGCLENAPEPVSGDRPDRRPGDGAAQR